LILTGRAGVRSVTPGCALQCKARPAAATMRIIDSRRGKPMTTRRAILTLPLLSSAALSLRAAPAPSPTLSGATTLAEPVSLERLRGSVAMIFFWSTDCALCLDKLPELRRNVDGWLGKPFVILAVSQDRSLEDLRAYEKVLRQTGPDRAQFKLLWRRAPAHRDGFGELPRRSPTTFVIDKQGQVAKTISGRVPAEIWDDIAELVLG
jgi:peroxiredoxin